MKLAHWSSAAWMLTLCGLLAACDEAEPSAETLEVAAGSAAVELDVGARGGVLEIESRARVTVPPGALDDDVTIRAEVGELESYVRSPDAYEVIGEPLVVTPHGLKLGREATIELAIDDLESPKKDLRVLRLDDEDDRTWEELDDLRVVAMNEPGRPEGEFDFDRSGEDTVSSERRIEFDVRGFSIFLPVRLVATEGSCIGKNRGEVCRASAGGCDVEEVCDGNSPVCPDDTFESSGAECRTSSGICDVAEVCTGDSAECPEDGVRAADSVCRPARGDCDEAEVCDGQNAACPENGYASGGVCRAPGDLCDASESCDGSGPDCPEDAAEAAGTVCEAAAGCNAEALCDGASMGCPIPAPAALGTVCDDGFFCTALDLCNGLGSCTGSGDPCADSSNDGDTDCSETCDESAGACTGDDPDGSVCIPTLACAAGECSSGTCGQTGPCPIYVKPAGTDGPTCGADWANACATVQQGSARAVTDSNPRVFVEAGSYLASGAPPVLAMADGISYFGGFAGTEDAASQRPDPIASFSVLDGNSTATSVVTGASNALLDGFEVRGGVGPEGGGMANISLLNLTVQHSTFVSNGQPGVSSGRGGGMYNSAVSNLVVRDVAFGQNRLIGPGAQRGGGMFSEASTVTLTDVAFLENAVTGTDNSARGGGLCDQDTDTTLTNVRFEGNTLSANAALVQGGGYAITGGGAHTTNLTNVVFDDNNIGSQGSPVRGGGLFLQGGGASIAGTTFIDNTASGFGAGGLVFGGGAAFDNTTAGLDRVRFLSNDITPGTNGTADGGGLYVASTDVTTSYVDFVENVANAAGTLASRGGGFFQEAPGSLDMSNSSFVRNSADNSAGLCTNGSGGVSIAHTSIYANLGTGLYIGGSVTNASVTNTVFADHSDQDILDDGTNTSYDYVCSESSVGTNHVMSVPGDLTSSLDGNAYLTASSACANADAGAETTADTVYGSGVWQSMTTMLDGSADGSAVDLGRHYDAQGIFIRDFSHNGTTASWDVVAPPGTRCSLAAVGYDYDIPAVDLPTGNVTHNNGTGQMGLLCENGGVQARVIGLSE